MLDFGDGEDYDFIPTENSKLSSLFGNSIPGLPNDTDLTYTAPKQPSVDQKDGQIDSKVDKQPNTKVLIVKVVNLWKLEDKTYKSLGKHGLGLIGSTDSKTQEIIAYKSKDLVVLRVKVSEKFLFSLQKDNFSSFHDNDSQNWLVKFESNDQNEFCTKLKAYNAKIIDFTKESSTVLPKNFDNDKPKPDLLPKPCNLGTGDQESDSSEKRANILNRITKLGQQTVLRSVSTASDGSDNEGAVKNRKHRKPKKMHSEKVKVTESPTDEACPKDLAMNNYIPAPFTSTPYPMWVAHQPDLSSFLLAQNMELKQTLSTISNKLDSINIPKVCNDNNSLISKLKALELKSDNLQTVADGYKNKYEELEAKYLELVNKDKNKSSESDALVSIMQTQVATLKLQLEVANEGITELKQQTIDYENAQKTLMEYEKTIEEQQSRLTELEEFYEENKEVASKKEAINSLNGVVNDLNQRLKSYEDKITKSELEQEQLRRKDELNVKRISNLIKVYMNEMYQNILSNYNEEYSYTYDEIKTVIADNMKGATLKLIEHISENFDKE